MINTKPDKGKYQKFLVGKLKYNEYLKTDHWFKTKKEAVLRCGGRCQLCNSKKLPLNTHHRTYNNLWEEKDYDLIVLCRDCHALHHHKVDKVFWGELIKVPGIGDATFNFLQETAKKVAEGLEGIFNACIQAFVVQQTTELLYDVDLENTMVEHMVTNNEERQIALSEGTAFAHVSMQGFVVSSLGFIKDHHPDCAVYIPLAKKYKFLNDKGFFKNKKYQHN